MTTQNCRSSQCRVERTRPLKHTRDHLRSFEREPRTYDLGRLLQLSSCRDQVPPETMQIAASCLRQNELVSLGVASELTWTRASCPVRHITSKEASWQALRANLTSYAKGSRLRASCKTCRPRLACICTPRKPENLDPQVRPHHSLLVNREGSNSTSAQNKLHL